MAKKKQSKRKKSTPKKVPKKVSTLKKPAPCSPATKATKDAAMSHDHAQDSNENEPARPNPFSDKARFQELVMKVRLPIIIARTMDTFSDAEQQRIIDEGLTSFSIIDIWARIKGVSQERAVVEMAYENNFITEPDVRRWLRILGEEVTGGAALPRPEWDRKTGELRLGGTIIKRVRRLKVASNVTIILGVFQDVEWSSYIDDPLPPSKRKLEQTSVQRLQDAIKSLNKNLEMIRFRSTNRGRGIAWEHV